MQWADGAFLPIFHVISPHIRCDRKFPPPVIRRGEKEESVDRTRIGASAVTCENRKRELSPPVVLHVLLPLFLLSIRSFGAPTLHPLIFSFSLSHSFSLSSLSSTNVKINAKKKRERERKSSIPRETLFYTSVRLTLNRNERRRLKTRSHVLM